jgi:hypothetical protein
MARRKLNEINKFGGTKELGSMVEKDAVDAPVKDIHWSAQDIETQSETHLEDDKGIGAPAMVRMFEFAVNRQVFIERNPTKQDLFNYHIKGIEMSLWKDGLKLMTDVEPKVVMDGDLYRIFVGAAPARGQKVFENPITLSTLIHG